MLGQDIATGYMGGPSLPVPKTGLELVTLRLPVS